jgi:tRNA threonylcarbamoyladenosine biosynthesis protein TsaB
LTRTLVIDCATDACSVALFEGDRLVGGDCRVLVRGHAEALVPMIADLPGKGKAARIVVSLGPGSFTGVRVGLAAARGLQLAWGSELLGYSTPAMIAAMAQAKAGGQPVAVVMTGGHGEWFVQRFAADGLPLDPVASLAPDMAAQVCTEAWVAGSQAKALVTLRGFGEALDLLPDAQFLPLLAPASLTGDVRALYGRAPDARLPGV